MIRPPPGSTLFPYTTLFRSAGGAGAGRLVPGDVVGEDWQSGPRRGLQDVGWWHTDPELLPVVADYARERIPALTDTSFVARALSTGRPVVVEEDATARIREVLSPGPAHELLEQLAPDGFAVLPLRGRGRTVGLLSLFTGSSRGAIGAVDLATATDIAG